MYKFPLKNAFVSVPFFMVPHSISIKIQNLDLKMEILFQTYAHKLVQMNFLFQSLSNYKCIVNHLTLDDWANDQCL